jgi:hypothetical protein
VKFWLPYFGPSLGTVAHLVNAKKIAILDNVIPHEKRFGDSAFTKYFLKAYNKLQQDLLLLDKVFFYN